MSAKQEVSLIGASAMVHTLLSFENSHFQRLIEEKALSAGVTREGLVEFSSKLSQKSQSLMSNEGVILSQAFLPEEFSLFFSWLMVGMANREDSAEFNLNVRSNCATTARDLGFDPADHYLQVVGWVIGKSVSRQEAFPATFPEQSTESMSTDARLAFQGLVDHALFIESDSGQRHQVAEAEMALTSIPIRVMGLAEAILRPNSGNTVGYNLEVLRNAVRRVRAFTPTDFSNKWREPELEKLVHNRDAVAHVWISDPEKPSLKEVLDGWSPEYTGSLFALSTYIVAGVALETLKETSYTTASHWFAATNRELDNIWVWE